jgi:hypothetical protein
MIYNLPMVSELSVHQGVLGSLLIKLNVEVALYRRNSVLNDWPVLEVVGASAITAAISYLVRSPSINTTPSNNWFDRLFSLGKKSEF